ncbi:hypothetical protein KC352_g45399, partial [Hortaea werneckii]
KSLGKAALRKKNKYAGGNHWIKVTFDSREAAELACARSPHQVRGYLVSAEPWIGRGPARDNAVPATNAGTRTRGVALPPSSSTQTVSPDSSRTVSSQTEQQTPPRQPRSRARDEKRDAPPLWQQPSAPLVRASSGFELAEQQQQQNQQQQQVTHRRTGTRGRIEGAKFVSALPAEVALMPKQPKQSWTAWLGASEVIGTTVPRKEDGTFDYDRA